MEAVLDPTDYMFQFDDLDTFDRDPNYDTDVVELMSCRLSPIPFDGTGTQIRTREEEDEDEEEEEVVEEPSDLDVAFYTTDDFMDYLGLNTLSDVEDMFNEMKVTPDSWWSDKSLEVKKNQ